MSLFNLGKQLKRTGLADRLGSAVVVVERHVVNVIGVDLIVLVDDTLRRRLLGRRGSGRSRRRFASRIGTTAPHVGAGAVGNTLGLGGALVRATADRPRARGGCPASGARVGPAAHRRAVGLGAALAVCRPVAVAETIRRARAAVAVAGAIRGAVAVEAVAGAVAVEAIRRTVAGPVAVEAIRRTVAGAIAVEAIRGTVAGAVAVRRTIAVGAAAPRARGARARARAGTRRPPRTRLGRRGGTGRSAAVVAIAVEPALRG
jgi:hypothetical protein